MNRLVVEATGRARPWALCITAASGDDPRECDAFGSLYGDQFRCRTDYLRLLKGRQDGDDFWQKITRSEVIFFADGDVRLLLNTLRQFQVDEALRRAYARGVVFGGQGAGAICWGQYALDTESLPGLGYLDVGLGLDFADRSPIVAIQKEGRPGVLLQPSSLLHIRENEYRFATGGARRLAPDGQARHFTSTTNYHPITDLTVTNGNASRIGA